MISLGRRGYRLHVLLYTGDKIRSSASGCSTQYVLEYNFSTSFRYTYMLVLLVSLLKLVAIWVDYLFRCVRQFLQMFNV